MHLADGFLQAPVIAATAVLAAGAVAVAAKMTPREELTTPMVGASAAFILAAQMINFPVASSVSGHIIGGVLLAILLGYRVSVLVMTAVLSLQALIFQDGGIAALGANILNLGVAGPGIGYLVYRITCCRIGSTTWTWRRGLGAFLGGWISSLVGAFFAALELWLSGQAALSSILWLLLGIHGIIGIAEGIGTLFVARFLNHHNQQSCELSNPAPGANCS